MKLLITGGNGLVGSRVCELLSSSHEIEKASRETGIDITDKEKLLDFFKNSGADLVVHMAAKADVDGCELDKNEDLKNIEDKGFNWGSSDSAYAVNVVGTRNVTACANETKKKLIYISTDFVFDGQKESPYEEGDLPNPINWYAQTKYLGEKEAEEGQDVVIARLAYPFRAEFEKKDFVRAMISRFREGLEVKAITDHAMTPTYVDDVASAIEALISKWGGGIYHVVGSSFVSPLEAALRIADVFGFDKSLISETTREEFFKNRAPRPFHLALKNDKIRGLGVDMKTFEQGLFEIKSNL